ncbi:hypothetical protein AB8A21_39900 [Streptomyces sp. BF23-18]|uniref:hypothetical protein n=1 Tax=Streptomyces sp. BF23-18 TaxID=3240282 RepID=UPI0034E3CA65
MAALEPEESAQLITALRHGRGLDDAARELRLDLAAVWTTARTDTRLTIALAGRDPDAAAEKARTARAEYLRLLALGLPPTHAELILGSGHVGTWRTDPAYAKACAAAAEAAAPYAASRWARLTPATVARFLADLSTPHTSVKAAAAAASVTTQAIYQRRRRDPAFASAMDEARRAAADDE